MSVTIVCVGISVMAGLGVLLLISPGVNAKPKVSSKHKSLSLRPLLMRSGLESQSGKKIVLLMCSVFTAGCVVGWIAFGGMFAPLVCGSLLAVTPVGALRARIQKRKTVANQAWPRMIEEIRLRCTSLGQSIPHALLETGLEGPLELRSAFLAAQREWLVTTDFERTIRVLESKLCDPTADIVCETLLTAHRVGGTDIARRLQALGDDRRQDLNSRQDAISKQAGVKFARRFVVVVPAGMAVVGMSIGDGREAYSSSIGQIGVVFALAVLAGCWIWAGRLIRLPGEVRVLRHD